MTAEGCGRSRGLCSWSGKTAASAPLPLLSCHLLYTTAVVLLLFSPPPFPFPPLAARRMMPMNPLGRFADQPSRPCGCWLLPLLLLPAPDPSTLACPVSCVRGNRQHLNRGKGGSSKARGWGRGTHADAAALPGDHAAPLSATAPRSIPLLSPLRVSPTSGSTSVTVAITSSGLVHIAPAFVPPACASNTDEQPPHRSSHDQSPRPAPAAHSHRFIAPSDAIRTHYWHLSAFDCSLPATAAAVAAAAHH